MKLDFSSLDRALASLGRATERSMRDPSDEEVRDAVILRFEYCYELSWKMLKRQLEQELPNPADADRMSFAELIREGAERGLVAHPERWLSYRYQRNLTSHASERDIRPLAVFRKVTGGTRSENGRKSLAHWMSLTQTLRKNEISVRDHFCGLYESHLADSSPPSVFASI